MDVVPQMQGKNDPNFRIPLEAPQLFCAGPLKHDSRPVLAPACRTGTPGPEGIIFFPGNVPEMDSPV